MDRITLCDVEVKYHVGVPDEERAVAQRLLLTVELFCDFAPAAGSDDLAATVDYFAVYQELQRFGEGKSWKLIEKLAVDLADMILRKYRATRVAVEVKKFILPGAKYVSARVERTGG